LFENICQVGVLLVNRSELLEMQRVKMGEEEGAEGFNLHTQRAGDRLRLQVLVDRYGEDYNLLNLPSWVREAQEEDRLRVEQGQAGGGMSTLEQWVLRRSDDDVMAFRKWFNDMYQRDPGVGMKMLDWKMPSIWDLPDSEIPPPVPTEWTRLKKVKPGGERAGDDEESQSGQGRLVGAESLVRSLLQKRTGVDGEMIKVAEFCLTMVLLSGLLVFGPPFAREWVQRDPTHSAGTNLPPGVGGVDAYLLQTDLTLEAPFDLTALSSDSSSSLARSSEDSRKTLTTEMRSQVNKLIREGKDDAEILRTPLSSSALSYGPVRKGVRVSAADVAKLRKEVSKEDAAAASQTTFWCVSLRACACVRVHVRACLCACLDFVWARQRERRMRRRFMFIRSKSSD
jgi:hypothetical protein